jgi:predicted AlkP superfamily phosphohydrolase/phosphomutase
MVSGMGTPGHKADFVHPSDLKGELLREFGLESLFEPPIVDQEPAEYFAELEAFAQDNYRVFEWLQNRFPDLDCQMAVFVAPDRIQHVAWHHMDRTSPRYSDAGSAGLQDAILNVYQVLDTIVGRIASARDSSTTLIVMSDHGAGSYRKFVDLNAWLAREGMLSFGETGAQFRDQIFSQVYRMWRNGLRNLLSAWQRRRLKEWLPRRLKTRVDSEWRNPSIGNVDWSRTQAFSEGTEGLIRLNLQGREPQGIVEPSEREEILKEIETRLYQLKDPDTERPVVERVWRREAIYDGAATRKAPDLIVEWSEEQYHSRALWNSRGQVFVEPGKWKTTQMTLSGHHCRDGVIFAEGPFVDPGTCIRGAKIIDLAPTILAIMDLPLQTGFDGQVLPELTVGLEGISVQEAEGEQPRAEESLDYSEEDRRLVEDVLRGLGYIE